MKRKVLISLVLSLFFTFSSTAQTTLGTMRSGKTMGKRLPVSEQGLANQLRTAPPSLGCIGPEAVRESKGKPRQPTTPKKPVQARPGAYKTVSDPNAPTIYGFNHITGDWSTPSTLPAGIYSFQATSPMQLTEVSTGAQFPTNVQLAFHAEGKFYLMKMETSYDETTWETKAHTTLYIYNADTWEQEGDVIDLADLYPMQCATYNPAMKKVYFFIWNKDFDKEFCSMDLSTFEVEHICVVSQFFIYLAAKADGTMYSHNIIDGMMYRIDTNGSLTPIAQANVAIQNGTSPAEAFYDNASGKMYVVAQLSDFTTHLYTVDENTAQYTEIDQFPGGEHFRGIFIVSATPGAPKAVDNITWAFTDDALSQLKLEFDLPTQNSEGEQLESPLNVVLALDGVETAFEGTPGEHVVREFTLEQGEHKVEIVVKNAQGDSPTRSFKVYAGQDVPGPVGNLNFEIDYADNTANVTWEAPTASMHGAALDFSKIFYKVVRMPGNVLVADNLTATSFSETMPEARAHYYYVVTPCTSDGEGVSVESNKIAYGSYYQVPFADDFSSEEDFNTYTIIDANGDGIGWMMGWWGGLSSPNSWGICDDYLFTPALKGFKKDNLYRLTFSISGGCFEDFNGQPGTAKITAYLAKDNQVTDELQLLNEYPIQESDTRTYSTVFEVPEATTEDTPYYIVLRSTGYSGENLTLYNLFVDVDAAPDAPAAVTDVVLAAGANGDLSEELTFNAPTKKRNGQSLDAIQKIEIYKDIDLTDPVKTYSDVTPGQALSYSEFGLSQGVTSYFIRAYADEQMGERHVATNYVGVDMPQMVEGFKVTMPQDGVSHLTWDAVPAEGQNGGYTGQVTYTIKRLNTYHYDWDDELTYDIWEDLVTGVTGTEYDDASYGFKNAGEQTYAQYGIFPVSEGGTNHGVTATNVIGIPYELPYRESFAQEGLDTYPWVLHNGVGQNGWGIMGASGAVQPFDEDGGELAYTNSGLEPTSGYIQGPRVTLKGDAPAITFYMYHGVEADQGDAYITVLVSVDDDEWKDMAVFDYNDGTQGWKKHVVDITPFAGSGNVTFQFFAYTADASATLYVDAIEVDEYADNDLAIQEYEIPVRMNIGQETKAKALVINSGSKVVEGYQVELTKNGASLERQQGATLNPNDVKEFAFVIENDIIEAGDSAKYAINILFDADQKPENNTTGEVAAYINGPKYPFVANIEGDEENGTVNLSWAQPSSEMTDPVLDDFESYEAFIIDGIGDWTVYDGDKDIPIYFGGPDVPHKWEPMAFWVWNRDEAGFQNFDVLLAHSGKQQLMAFSATDGESKTKPNDNWLISPEITPMSDVTFWMKESQLKYGPETFEMLYTSMQMPEGGVDDAFLASFQKLGEGVVDYVSWRQMGYTLPADARYFAIRHNTQENGMVLMLDDITYTPLHGATTTLSLQGYNIYRDGVKIAGPVSMPVHADADATEGSHSYQVSVVWSVGESMLSAPLEINVTSGVAQMEGGQTRVHCLDGRIVIEGASGMSVAIYSADGKMNYKGKGESRTAVAVQKGIYTVVVDGKSYKVVVN